jgi:predicted permease
MRAYRLLLRLFPAPLRDEYGAELAATFARELATARGPARVRVWLAGIADVAVSAVRAHADLTWQDLRDTARTCRRNRGFAAAVVAVSALGVGAATATFSVADHVLVRPLPFADADRLVKLWQDQSYRGYSRMELSPGNYEDWRAQSRSLESSAAYTTNYVNAITSAGPLRLDAAFVTPGLFGTLGVSAALGRPLVSADDRGVTTRPMVLSDRLWRSAFGARADVLGTTMSLSGEPHIVVGVMPRGFDFPRRDTDLWVPLAFAPDDLADRSNVYLQAIGRLRPGVSLAEARAELNVIAEGLARAFPDANDRTGATVIQLRDEVSRQSRLLLLALVGAAVCVLLIACANLASLLLARAVQRQRELAVRAAMGARPRRLARQVLTESLGLSVLGGAIGMLLALAAVPAAAALVPTTLPIASAPAADLRMLAVAALATIVTGVGFGLVPAWRISRSAQRADLRHGTRVVGSGGTERLRGGFVVAEVAAAVVLLVTVGLFLRALWRVQDVPPGFDAGGVLTARTALPMPKYEVTAAREQFYARVLAEVRALPGVTTAAYTSFLPMVMRGGIWPVLTPQSAVPEESRMASVRYVTPDYFATLKIPLLRGRDVALSDTQTSPFVALVSESFAATHWPGQDPLGQHFSIALQERVVAGVVGDVRVRGLERESEPQVYLPSPQVPDGGIIFYAPKDLVIRFAGSPAALVPAVRAAVARADPEQPVADVRTLADIVRLETSSRSAQLTVLLAFASMAMLLASLGIHGLLSYVVAARTPEIGVRMAFGATPGRVLGLVLGRTAVLAGAGVAVGLLAAFAVSQSLQALLAGVSPADASTFATAALLALVVALAASVLPALRAVRVDPLTAMRAE